MVCERPPRRFAPPLLYQEGSFARRYILPKPDQILNCAFPRCRDKVQSKRVFDTKTEVNIFDASPIASVTANPRTAPVPNRNRKAADIKAAKCVSTSVMNTRLKLVATAVTGGFPVRIS